MGLQLKAELSLEAFLPYVMNRLSETISSELSSIYVDEYGLSIAQWRVIANLAQHTTLKAQDIVVFTAMEKSMISRAVNALVDRGLVTGTASAQDSRARDLRLTREGADLYRTIVPNVLNWEKELLSCLTESDYQSLMATLAKLKLKLEKKGGELN